MPLEKCNPSLAPAVTTTAPPQPITPPGPFWPSPAQVQCGATFFSTTTEQQLAGRFGSIECFRFENGNTWIIVGDGMSTTSQANAGTPGGAMVAVTTCAAGDSTCLDPNASHDFSAFTVSYPPQPDTWPLKLETTFGGRVLYLADANCGLFSFDTASQRWFGHAPSDINAILSGSGTPQAIAAPGRVAGADAPTQGPPPAVIASCG